MRFTKFSSRSWCFALVTFGLLLASGGTPAQPLTINKVLIIVNREAITLSQYQARHQLDILQRSLPSQPVTSEIDPLLLDRMINELIQTQFARQRGIRVSPQEINRAIAFLAQQKDISPQQLFADINQIGITTKQFRNSVKQQRIIIQVRQIAVNSRVQVSDQEVDNYLLRHADLIQSDRAYEVSHLAISLTGKSAGKAKAEYKKLTNIRQKLIEGGSFSEAVQKHSDASDREQKGYLGWREVAQLPELFVQALGQTKVGQISQIIKSESALHLLKLHEQRGDKIVDQQKVRQILIRPNSNLSAAEASELTAQLYQRILAGEDFAKIAKLYSADQTSAYKGGLLGWLSAIDAPPQLEKAMRALAIGEVSKPLQVEAGHHILQVLARRQQDSSMDLAAERARQAIFSRKAREAYDNWFGPLRDTSYIEYISVNPS